ncbi:hypothetical protein [Bradyrhizobium iriomotense]|uniref:hypothetical protein n=1 Tax=Bradyrhizobium iriomotense TaxID=441950 RepID=UPI001B8A663F|nr:hypothetical protein [Bradyrhizobium iriomotense]MBR1132099.1 hypothetical protein [Bradyrhizobium iriomotense]
MPTILELLYKEFCRARLAEMRRQLLLTGKHPELLQVNDDLSDSDNLGEMDTQHEAEPSPVRK